MRAAHRKSWLRSSVTRSILAPGFAAGVILAAPAMAQQSDSVTDYRLPDPKQTQAPRVQGPVDPDNPVSAPATPRPERTPAPTPTPAPRVTVPAPQQTRTPPQPAPERREPRPTATQSESPRTQDRPSATPTPSPAPPTSAPVPAPAPTSTTPPLDTQSAVPEPTTEPVVTAEPAAPQSVSNWLIPGVLGAALLAGGAVLFLRRRRQADTAIDEEAAAPASPPAPPPVPATSPQVGSGMAQPPASPLAKPATAAPSLTVEPLHLATAFRAKAVRLSLVYATVQYELEIANAGTSDLAQLQIRADLMSAHSSLGTHEQLAPARDTLEVKHTVPGLASGESQTLKGEVRVPLGQIRPLVKGNAQFLVPLVRFCILAPDGSGVRRVYTVGPSDAGSGTIASVRLDAGPRNLRELDAREIEAARGFALDPQIVHG
jgi:LPXTG-motif cell wall-anchored protein